MYQEQRITSWGWAVSSIPTWVRNVSGITTFSAVFTYLPTSSNGANLRPAEQEAEIILTVKLKIIFIQLIHGNDRMINSLTNFFINFCMVGWWCRRTQTASRECNRLVSGHPSRAGGSTCCWYKRTPSILCHTGL